MELNPAENHGQIGIEKKQFSKNVVNKFFLFPGRLECDVGCGEDGPFFYTSSSANNQW